MSVKLRKKPLAKGRESLYLDIYHKGRRGYEFLNLYLEKGNKAGNKDTLRLAEAIEAKRKLELHNAEHGFVVSFKKQSNFLEYFQRQAEQRPRSKGTWLGALKHLQAFTGGKTPFNAIDESWCKKFRGFLLSRLSINASYTYFNILKISLNQAVRDKIIAFNPAKSVQVAKEEKERTYLTLKEIQALAVTPCINAEVKKAFLFCCYTGLRKSDIRHLTCEQIHEGAIHFSQKKTGGMEYLPLSKTALQLLGNPDGQSGKIFNLPSHETIRVQLNEWVKQAGIKKHITFHASRHTFATLSLTHGVDLYTVSKLLGHKEIQTTQIYARIVDEKKRQAINMLPELTIDETLEKIGG